MRFLLYLHLLLFFTCASVAAEQKFILSTQPKTGTGLLANLANRFTNKIPKHNHNKTFRANVFEKEEEFNRLKNDTDYIYWFFSLKPVAKNKFVRYLDKVEEENKFLFTHAPYTHSLEKLLKERDTISLFMKRDPRDYCVSVVNYYRKMGRYSTITDRSWTKLSFDDQLTCVITGTDWYNSVRKLHELFYPWTQSDVCVALTYENLVDTMEGESNLELRVNEIRKLADAFSFEASDEELLSIFNEVGLSGVNLIHGKSGTWKYYFKEEHKKIFKEHMGEILIELGYEDDYDW